MGLVSIRFREGRKKPYGAQWRQHIDGQLRAREQWFKTEELALKFKTKHEAESETFEGLSMSPEDRARWWRFKEDCAAARLDPEKVMAAGLATLKSRTVKTASLADALIVWDVDAGARRLRPASVRSMKQAVGAYAKGREKTPVNTVRSADLLAWIATRYTDQVSRDGMLGRLLTFFRWCASLPREWCRKEEFTGVKWAQRVKGEKKRIGFYTAAEAGALLEAVDDSLKCALATGFFTGLRPFEMQRVRLAWRNKGEFYGYDAQRGEWHLAPEWAKTRAYRKLYALPDCWHFWWIKYQGAIAAPYRGKQRKREGFLSAMNYRNFRAAMARARAAAGLVRAPKDGIRHSFGTHGYHRSADGKERGVEWCIALMGHVDGFGMFEASYNGKVSTAEAEAYFALYPAGAACDVKTRARVVV